MDERIDVALRELAAGLEFPATPDLTARVIGELRAPADKIMRPLAQASAGTSCHAEAIPMRPIIDANLQDYSGISLALDLIAHDLRAKVEARMLIKETDALRVLSIGPGRPLPRDRNPVRPRQLSRRT